MRLQELEWLGHTRHRLCGALHDLGQLRQSFLIIRQQLVAVVVDLLLQLLVLDALNYNRLTKSSSFSTFFLSLSAALLFSSFDI